MLSTARSQPLRCRKVRAKKYSSLVIARLPSFLVRSFGTEDRQAPAFVPPNPDVYEIVIFRADDIKDIQVLDECGPIGDPAVVTALPRAQVDALLALL